MDIVVWVVAALILAVAEVVTLAFVAVYLAVGAIAAAVAAGLGAAVGAQVVVFGVVSVLSLVLTRAPLRRALDRTPIVLSNTPTVIGKRGVITVAIEEGPGTRGQVRVGTEYWSARSENERPIADGTTVEVVAIDGVALVVRAARPMPAA